MCSLIDFPLEFNLEFINRQDTIHFYQLNFHPSDFDYTIKYNSLL